MLPIIPEHAVVLGIGWRRKVDLDEKMAERLHCIRYVSLNNARPSREFVFVHNGKYVLAAGVYCWTKR